jgi:hypothetical protein
MVENAVALQHKAEQKFASLRRRGETPPRRGSQDIGVG